MLTTTTPDEVADLFEPKHVIERGTPVWGKLREVAGAVERGLPVAEGFLLFYSEVLRQAASVQEQSSGCNVS